jgi:hypothetical protein
MYWKDGMKEALGIPKDFEVCDTHQFGEGDDIVVKFKFRKEHKRKDVIDLAIEKISKAGLSYHPFIHYYEKPEFIEGRMVWLNNMPFLLQERVAREVISSDENLNDFCEMVAVIATQNK